MKSKGFDEGLQMAEDTECWIRMLGSPYDLGERPTYQFFQIDAVGGHHRLGDHQTINGGLQTSASYDGTSADVADRVSAFESFTNQVRSIIGSQHPRPPKELPVELPRTRGSGRRLLVVVTHSFSRRRPFSLLIRQYWL